MKNLIFALLIFTFPILYSSPIFAGNCSSAYGGVIITSVGSCTTGPGTPIIVLILS